MSISPISSVSFNNYNNVSFEGRRSKNHSEHNHSTSPLRAVPLAALIAMSPMVNTYAQVNPTEHTEFVQNGIQYVGDGYNSVATLLDVETPHYEDCAILWPKNSNNPKDKVLFYVETARIKTRLNGNDELVPVILEKESLIRPQKLIVVNEDIKNDHGATTAHNVIYYVSGYRTTTDGYYEIKNNQSGSSQGDLLKTKSYAVPNSELRISKQFYNQLKLIYGDSIEYTTENRQRVRAKALFSPY